MDDQKVFELGLLVHSITSTFEALHDLLENRPGQWLGDDDVADLVKLRNKIDSLLITTAQQRILS